MQRASDAPLALLPRQKMLMLPDQVELSHIYDNGKLLKDKDIQNLIAKQNTLQIGRNKAEKTKTLYDIIYLNNEIYAIYLGARSGKSLGDGGFGFVKLVQNLNSGEWEALKIVSEKLDKAIHREFAMLSEVGQGIGCYQRKNHHGISQVEILMKLAPGMRLHDYVKNDLKLAAIEYIEVVITLLELCDSLLDKKILHRDIKTRNVMLELVNYVLTVVDYGLAVKMNEADEYESGRGVGTPLYVAPEIRESKKEKKAKKKDKEKTKINQSPAKYSEKTEIYALAITISEILRIKFDTSVNAFYSDRENEEDKLIFEDIIADKKTRNRVTSNLSSMTQRDSTQRPTVKNAATFFRDIRDALGEEERIITIGCLDLIKYFNSSDKEKKRTDDWLKQMHRVCLIDNEIGKGDKYYISVKREMEKKGLVVLPEIVRYDSDHRGAQMPLAVSEYLKILPNVTTRHYVGCFILDDEDIENDVPIELKKNGLIYVHINQSMRGQYHFIYWGKSIQADVIAECLVVYNGELKRLEGKNTKKPSEDRAHKIEVLRKTIGDINIAASGTHLVRYGMYTNIVSEFKAALSAHNLDNTLNVVSKAGAVITESLKKRK